MQTRKLATSCEGLNSSITWRVMELQNGTKIVPNVGFQKYKYFVHRQQRTPWLPGFSQVGKVISQQWI